MKRIIKVLKNNKGSIVSFLLIFTLVVVFVVLPIFSVIFEQYVLLLKGQAIKDAVDVTNLSAYNAMKVQEKSETKIIATANDIQNYYIPMLALNMKLNSDLTPKEHSIADGKVEIVDIIVYHKGMSFPVTCPQGGTINRPSVHSQIKVPIKPTLYWNIQKMLTGSMGEGVKYHIVHIDTELPYNNPD